MAVRSIALIVLYPARERRREARTVSVLETQSITEDFAGVGAPDRATHFYAAEVILLQRPTGEEKLFIWAEHIDTLRARGLLALVSDLNLSHAVPHADRDQTQQT